MAKPVDWTKNNLFQKIFWIITQYKHGHASVVFQNYYYRGFLRPEVLKNLDLPTHPLPRQLSSYIWKFFFFPFARGTGYHPNPFYFILSNWTIKFKNPELFHGHFHKCNWGRKRSSLEKKNLLAFQIKNCRCLNKGKINKQTRRANFHSAVIFTNCCDTSWAWIENATISIGSL